MSLNKLTIIASASNSTTKDSGTTKKNSTIKLNPPAEHDPIKCFRDSVGIGTLNGVDYINFSTNHGPGSSSQTMEVSQIPDLVHAMLEICENGIPEQLTNVSPAQMMRSTIRLDEEGYFKFRLSADTKSVKVRPADFSRLCNELAGLGEKIAAAKSKRK